MGAQIVVKAGKSAVLLVLAALSAGFFLTLGGRAGLIVGEILIPSPAEAAAPSYICYGSPAHPKPLCRAITAQQLQTVLADAEVTE